MQSISSMRSIAKIHTFILLCMIAFLLTACNKNRIPDEVMQPDVMVEFLSEAYLLEGFYAIESNYQYQEVSPQIKASYDSLLNRYGVTEEKFARSVEYYTQHPELFDTIHARTMRRLE